MGSVALAATIHWAAAEARPNPYQPIVERNAFGLKPPPPPTPPEQQEKDPKLPSKIKLTGLSNLFTKKAFLEIDEQEIGKPVVKRHVILAEAEGAYGVDVLAIDVEKNLVKIRYANQESDLTFEVPKPSAPPAPGGAGAQHPLPVVNPRANAAAAAYQQQQQQNQPTVISPGGNTGSGVTLVGGGENPATSGAGVTTLGGAVPAVPSPLGTDTGLRNIPARTIRTPNVPQVDPAQQAILMEAERIRQQQQQQQQGQKYRGPPIVTPPLPQNLQNPQQ